MIALYALWYELEHCTNYQIYLKSHQVKKYICQYLKIKIHCPNQGSVVCIQYPLRFYKYRHIGDVYKNNEETKLSDG